MVETLGTGSVVAWSICVGVAIGLLLSELLHKYDNLTEADDVPEEPAIPAGSDGDDGKPGVPAGDPLRAADYWREEGQYLTLRPSLQTSEKEKHQ